MADDTPSNVRPFRRLKIPAPPPEQPPPVVREPGSKMGLYPLAEDVIVSLPLFHVIVLTLERGAPEDRAALVASLKESYAAFFT